MARGQDVNPGKWTRQLLKKTPQNPNPPKIHYLFPFFLSLFLLCFSQKLQYMLPNPAIWSEHCQLSGHQKGQGPAHGNISILLGLGKRDPHTEPEKPGDFLYKYKVFDSQGALFAVK